MVVDNPIARMDDLTATQWEKLKFVFDYAFRHDIEVILQAGDLTHTRRSWWLVEELGRRLVSEPAKIYLVKGQHDSYYHDMGNQKTTTGVLISTGVIHLLDDVPTSFREKVHIYGCSYGEKIPEVKTVGINILVIHASIGHDKNLWNGHVDFTDADTFLVNHPEYDLILCGDVHEKFIVQREDRIICNTGVMLRLEASKQMMEHKPCFFVYDIKTSNIKEILIPTLSSDKVLSRDHIEKQKAQQENFADFVDRVKSIEGKGTINFADNLKQVIYKNKISKKVEMIIHQHLGGSDF